MRGRLIQYFWNNKPISSTKLGFLDNICLYDAALKNREEDGKSFCYIIFVRTGKGFTSYRIADQNALQYLTLTPHHLQMRRSNVIENFSDSTQHYKCCVAEGNEKNEFV